MRRSVLGLVTACLLLGSAASGHADNTASASGAWAERVQIVYDAATRSVERRRVKVWDDQPERNLDFVWEPAAGQPATLAADGTVRGEGKLVWRVRGSASYDPRTVYSTYTGTLRDGRPDGKGRLAMRSGEVFDGHWVAGRFEGEGVHLDGRGNRMEGSFVAGRLDGKGRVRSATGEIFTGTFVNGQKDGEGTTRLAGGTTYRSEWRMGRELGGKRPDALADAQVGGLLRAQAGGDADKVEISTVVDERVSLAQQQGQSGVSYQHLVRDEDVAIYPFEQSMNDAWNGDATISAGDWMYTSYDWAKAPVYVDVNVATSDGSRVKMQGMELQVMSSEPYRKPMLSVKSYYGCVGFRPEMTLLNHGWGGAKNARINIKFAGYEQDGPSTGMFSMSVPDFENGVDLDFSDILSQAGVDIEALKTQRFTCPSYEELDACKADAISKVNFGQIAPFVTGGDTLSTNAVGTFDYSWSDDFGNTYQQSEKLQFDLQLAAIEIQNPPLAEGGDGVGTAPAVVQFQPVDLPSSQSNYTVEIKLRGNKNVSQHTAALQISSDMTSFHQFQPVVKFADGSERRGKTVSLYFFRPRPSTYVSQVQTPQCYLTEPKPFDPNEVEGGGNDGADNGGGDDGAGQADGGGDDNLNK